MASPLHSRKASVRLDAPAVRVSRIRRDPPPPPPKEVTVAELRERDAWTIVIGIGAFVAAMLMIVIGFNNAAGWSPFKDPIKVHESS